jgi:hypothetical protein
MSVGYAAVGGPTSRRWCEASPACFPGLTSRSGSRDSGGVERAAVGTSDTEEWDVREGRTNRVLGMYSAATRPARGDVIELDDQPFKIELDDQPFKIVQVADLVVGNGERRQRGWLIVSSGTD